MARQCSIEGCDRIHYGKGYCNKHWQHLVYSPRKGPGWRREQDARRYAAHKHKIVARSRLRLTGVTQERFDEAIRRQQYKCALCCQDLGAGRALKPVADHCHKTKRFRGVLHSMCNIMLGGYEKVQHMPGLPGYLEGGSHGST